MIKHKLKPIVDFNKCGGKGPCISVCPHNVFDFKPIDIQDKKQLNVIGKLKTFFNKNKAYVARPDACQSCGLCVTACPEHAIKLVKQ